jgi:hypothetical protein
MSKEEKKSPVPITLLYAKLTWTEAWHWTRTKKYLPGRNTEISIGN